MNKHDLATILADRIGTMTKSDILTVIDGACEVITEALVEGDKVRLVGFGHFEVRDRKPRRGRNPRTGEPVTIPGAKTAAFVAGTGLKSRLRGA